MDLHCSRAYLILITKHMSPNAPDTAKHIASIFQEFDDCWYHVGKVDEVLVLELALVMAKNKLLLPNKFPWFLSLALGGGNER